MSIQKYFHKDNNTVEMELGGRRLSYLKRSMAGYNNTLPIEVLHLFKCFKYVEIKSFSTVSGVGARIEFFGNHDNKGISTAYQNDPVFWEKMIEIIAYGRDNEIISDEVVTVYVPKKDLYTMEQIVHLVNVIRGDLANQPKLLKKILDMEIDK